MRDATPFSRTDVDAWTFGVVATVCPLLPPTILGPKIVYSPEFGAALATSVWIATRILLWGGESEVRPH